jgi:hypothetical protein
VGCQCCCGGLQEKGFWSSELVRSVLAENHFFTCLLPLAGQAHVELSSLFKGASGASFGSLQFCNWNDSSTPAFLPTPGNNGASCCIYMKERGIAARLWLQSWGLSADPVYLFGLCMLAWLGLACSLPTITTARPFATTTYFTQLWQGTWREASQVPGSVHHGLSNRRMLIQASSRRRLQASPAPAASSPASPQQQQQQQQQQQTGQGLPQVSVCVMACVMEVAWALQCNQ